MKRDQICPADILIIDTKDEFCQVDSSIINGKSSFDKKLPLKSTSCKFDIPIVFSLYLINFVYFILFYFNVNSLQCFNFIHFSFDSYSF